MSVSLKIYVFERHLNFTTNDKPR